MDGAAATQSSETAINGGISTAVVAEKPKLVVIMGPTGSGKSRLAIDLASHFPIEIINADSMQVYEGLDVLTNKVPPEEQRGVPHHLLGTVSPDVEFTAKEFRDSAVSLIDNIMARNCLPVIAGGTNYYIQALVSLFLLDDSMEDMDETCLTADTAEDQPSCEFESDRDSSSYSYEFLKDVDPVAANRIHPNNHRKIKQYLNLYAQSGVLPSKLYQGKAAKNWGRVDDCRYNCCFVCVDASLPVLDQFVDQRVDRMIDDGLLDEVYDIYNMNMDYTRGLQQAIGVREFEEFLRFYLGGALNDKENVLTDESHLLSSMNEDDKRFTEKMKTILDLPNSSQHKVMLKEAIDNVKLNTRRLVRCQKRRLNKLEALFGWNIHRVDATNAILVLGTSDEPWAAQVVEPAVNTVRHFLEEDSNSVAGSVDSNDIQTQLIQRDLWTQYVCKACGDRVLRGAHEWEQHKQGRGHRKRICGLKKVQVRQGGLREEILDGSLRSSPAK